MSTYKFILKNNFGGIVLDIFKIEKGYFTGLSRPFYETINNNYGFFTQLMFFDKNKEIITEREILLSNCSQEEAYKNLEDIKNNFNDIIGSKGSKALVSRYTYLLKPVSLLFMYNKLMAITSLEPSSFIELYTFVLYDFDEYISKLKDDEASKIQKEISKLKQKENLLQDQLNSLKDFKVNI